MTRGSLVFYVARRLVALVVLIVVISFVVFSLLYLAPGEPGAGAARRAAGDPETIEAIREEYNLNEPFLVQYANWAEGALQLDFGRSIRTNEPVATGIADGFKLTLQLGGLAFLVTMLLGVPLGVLAALRSGRRSTAASSR